MTAAGVIARLKARAGMPPADQRRLWATEMSGHSTAAAKDSLADFRFPPAARTDELNVISMNAYYGQVASPDGEVLGVRVKEYACIFDCGADVILLQECVLGPIPPGAGTDAKGYRDRDAGTGGTYWAKWTKKFPETAFKTWLPTLEREARKRGYLSHACAAHGSSMYRQRFGNVVFYNPTALAKKGLRSRPRFRCRTKLLQPRASSFAGETENRAALFVDLGGTVIVNTHLSEKRSSNAAGTSSQSAAVEQILQGLRVAGGPRRVLIAGDFNLSDPATVTPAMAAHYTVAYSAEDDARPYDLLRQAGFRCLNNSKRVTAWNARHPDQACCNFADPNRFTKVLRPWNGACVLSDHAALAMRVPLPPR